MRRRDFITLFGAAAAWPLVARAQSDGRVRRIGVLLSSSSTDPEAAYVAAFEQVLRTLGWKIGQNLQIEYRWGEFDPARIGAYAAELVALSSEVIVAVPTVALNAVQKATRTIPIVFGGVSDPVAQGFVSSLARPGGNATGFAAQEFSIAGKWLDLLKQLTPALAHVGLLFNPTTSPQSRFVLDSIKSAASTLGVDEVTALPVHQIADIEPVLAGLARRPNGGFIVGSDNFLKSNDETVAALAIRYRLPAVYGQQEFIKAGGLAGYYVDTAEMFRGAAFYVDRILKVAKPGDLPVQLPSKYTLAINLKAVQALGIDLPMGLMLSANEVLE